MPLQENTTTMCNNAGPIWFVFKSVKLPKLIATDIEPVRIHIPPLSISVNLDVYKSVNVTGTHCDHFYVR